MSSFDSTPPQEMLKSNSEHAGQARQANDDPFGLGAPGPAASSHLGAGLPPSMPHQLPQQPMMAAGPSLDVQAMTKILQEMSQHQQTIASQNQQIQQEQQRHSQLINQLDEKQRLFDELIQEMNGGKAGPAGNSGMAAGANQSNNDFGFGF